MTTHEIIVSKVWKYNNVIKIVVLEQMLSDKRKCSGGPVWRRDKQWPRFRYIPRVLAVALSAE